MIAENSVRQESAGATNDLRSAYDARWLLFSAAVWLWTCAVLIGLPCNPRHRSRLFGVRAHAALAGAVLEWAPKVIGSVNSQRKALSAPCGSKKNSARPSL
jgi:hypothetical protein